MLVVALLRVFFDKALADNNELGLGRVNREQISLDGVRVPQGHAQQLPHEEAVSRDGYQVGAGRQEVQFLDVLEGRGVHQGVQQGRSLRAPQRNDLTKKHVST